MQNARQLTEISRITTFNLKNDNAHLRSGLQETGNLLMTHSNKTEKIL